MFIGSSFICSFNKCTVGTLSPRFSGNIFLRGGPWMPQWSLAALLGCESLQGAVTMQPLPQKCSFMHMCTHTRAHTHTPQTLKGFTESLLGVRNPALNLPGPLGQHSHSWEDESDGVIPDCWSCLHLSSQSAVTLFI